MAWPLIKLLPKKTNFTFVRFAVFAAFVSIAAGDSLVRCRCSSAGFRENPIAMYRAAHGSPMRRLGAILARGFNLGIDFKGGTRA